MTAYRDAAPARQCPRCLIPLDPRALGDAEIDECSSCTGVFVPRDLMPRVLDPLDLGGEVLATFRPGTPSALTPGPLYVHCPRCGDLMTRKQFATGAKIVVDVCRKDGLWFDAAELRAVAEFASGGGMERAARADAERAAAARQHDPHTLALGVNPTWPTNPDDRLVRFLDLLAALFR